MSQDKPTDQELITFQSARFGELSVAKDSVIEFPSGLIGFPRAKRYVMLDYKPPFSWLHSIDDAGLAFVVIDGGALAAHFEIRAPYGDRDIDLKDDDEYAVLVVVTVRPDARMTTANLKAPLFVNIRNRKGVQVIFDNPNLSTRYALWEQSDEKAEGGTGESKEATQEANKEKK